MVSLEQIATPDSQAPKARSFDPNQTRKTFAALMTLWPHAAVLAVFLMFAIGALLSWAGECGTSGNTYWSATSAGTNTVMAADATNIYWASGTTLEARTQQTGTQIWSRDFVPVTPGRPLPGVSSNSTPTIVFGGSDGHVYCLNQSTGDTIWSRSTRRPTCASDSITAEPVAQLRSLSNTNFKAAMTSDLVIAGTAYGCSTTTANKVYGLDGSTGNVKWIHNSSGTSYAYDQIAGMALSYGRNLVFVTMHKSNPTVSQNNCIALNTLNGSRVWYQDFGGISCAPVFAYGALYVATTTGAVARVDPATGQVIWSTVVTSGGAQIHLSPVVNTALRMVYVVDTGGTIHALQDDCTSVGYVWSSNLAGALASTRPQILAIAGKVYVGGSDGRVYQLDETNGHLDSYATITGSLFPVTDVVVTTGTSLRLIATGGGVVKRLCIAWLADGGDKS